MSMVQRMARARGVVSLALMTAAVACGNGEDAAESNAAGGTGGGGTGTLVDDTGGGTDAGGAGGGSGGTTGGSDGDMGGSDGDMGGSAEPGPSGPDSCSPDISSRMVPCAGTPAQVPTRTTTFSVTGPFSEGETVAVFVEASSGTGLTVQAFAEQASCDESMTLIEEVVVPNGDKTCVEVSASEATEAIRFELLDDSVTYPALHAVCGECP